MLYGHFPRSKLQIISNFQFSECFFASITFNTFANFSFKEIVASPMAMTHHNGYRYWALCTFTAYMDN